MMLAQVHHTYHTNAVLKLGMHFCVAVHMSFAAYFIDLYLSMSIW
jgi:uncharacterized protein with PQ loop repeat